MSTDRSEIQVGLTAILGWLAFYFDFREHLFETDHGFAYMAKIAPERGWSVLFLAAANFGVIGLISTRPAVRLASVLVIATMHGVFAGSLLMTDPSVWSGTYVIIAAMGYYLAYRHSHAGL